MLLLRHLFPLLCSLLSILLISIPVFSENSYDYYMKNWDENISMAKNYLDQAEQALEENDILLSCANQLKASEYGIKATESRIKAAEVSGLNGEISEIEKRNFMVPIESFKNSFNSSKDLSLSEETVALTPSGVRMIVPLIFLLEQ